MSLQELIVRGSVVSTGAPQFISIPSGFDVFHLRNRSTHAAGAGITDSWYYAGDPAGWATNYTVAATAVTIGVIAAGGFTYIDSSTAALGPAIALNGAFITQANPMLAATATPPTVGSVVRFYNTTGMLQVSGYDFTVTAVTPATNMTLGYISSAGFAAASTAGTFRTVPFDAAFYPPRRFITAITTAANAVVTLSVTHHYVVGNKVKFIVPAAYGMTQINGLVGTITAINTATNTITVDIDSTAFTAFAFPTSANYAAGVTPAQIVPYGEIASVTAGALRDAGTRGILIGQTIQGTSGNVFDYWAYRSE